MRDIGLLLWLRWRHLRGRLYFWAAIGGADLESGSLTNRLYAIYLAAMCTLWLYLMWASATDMVFETGLAGSGVVEPGMRVLTLVPFIAFALLSARALRSSPVKFTFQDMAYVAGTPVDRGGLALLDSVRETIPIALIVGLVDYLVAIALVPVSDVHAAVSPAWVSAAAAFVAIVLANALAWILGLLRVTARRSRPWPSAVWVLPLLALGLPFAAEAVTAWPGQAIIAPLRLASSAASLGALAMAGVVALVIVTVVGRRLDTVRVVDESGLYAQLQVYRPLAIYDSRAVRDITRRKKLAARKPVGRLPQGVGPMALVARAWVAHLRQPMSLLTPLLWGGTLVPSAVVLSLEPRHFLTYFPWFFAILIAPAENLVHVFREEMDRPSLRELLPFDNLALVLLEGLPALSVMTLAGIVVWIVQDRPLGLTVPAIMLTVLLGLVLFLCRGLQYVRVLGLKRPIGFPVSAGITCIAILYASAGGSLLNGCIVAIVCVAVLALALSSSET